MGQPVDLMLPIRIRQLTLVPYTFVFTFDESPPLVHIIRYRYCILFSRFSTVGALFFQGGGGLDKGTSYCCYYYYYGTALSKTSFAKKLWGLLSKYRTSLYIYVQQGYCTGSFPVTSAIGKRFFMLVTKFSETKHLNFYPKLRDKQHNILLSICKTKLKAPNLSSQLILICIIMNKTCSDLSQFLLELDSYFATFLRLFIFGK